MQVPADAGEAATSAHCLRLNIEATSQTGWCHHWCGGLTRTNQLKGSEICVWVCVHLSNWAPSPHYLCTPLALASVGVPHSCWALTGVFPSELWCPPHSSNQSCFNKHTSIIQGQHAIRFAWRVMNSSMQPANSFKCCVPKQQSLCPMMVVCFAVLVLHCKHP